MNWLSNELVVSIWTDLQIKQDKSGKGGAMDALRDILWGFQFNIENWFYPEEFQERLGDAQDWNYVGLTWTVISRIINYFDVISKGAKEEIKDYKSEMNNISDSELKELAIRLCISIFWELELDNINKNLDNTSINPYYKNQLKNIFLEESDEIKLKKINSFLLWEWLWIDFMSPKEDLKAFYVVLIMDKDLDNKLYWWNTVHSFEDRVRIDSLRKSIDV